MTENNELFNNENKTDNTENYNSSFLENPNDSLGNGSFDFYGQSNFDQQPKSQPPKKTHIPIIILLILIFIMISTLTVYCIYTDIQTGSIEFNTANNGGISNVSLDLYNKPESDKDIEYVDENGKYTTQGLAEYIRPQIVEIYAYNSEDPELVIASGSGVIITEDGYIVTNTHVLDGELYTGIDLEDSLQIDSIAVKTFDDKQFDAMIVGRDAKTDIAVIKIEASGLPCAVFGNSDETLLGEQVVAIGNPAGLTGSITNGIVSGLNRKIKADLTGFEMDCIQTNAAISPGNSGGALVNMYGQVIGITSSKYVNSSYEGLGFAITIAEAKPVIEELISTGYVSGRTRVGIAFYSTDIEYTHTLFNEKYKMDLPKNLEGIWITEISDDCDVSKTELKVDDFILTVNGAKVQNYEQLNVILEGKKGGDVLKAECARIDGDMNISYFEIEFKLMEDTSGDF